MKEVNLKNQPIKMHQQFFYALNEIGSNPIYTIALSFLTFFYTDILGINAGIVGIIILISKMFDGVSDIFAGNIIDHTKTKNGSARPWILRSAIPMALSYVILFTVPDIGLVGKVIYIFVSYNFAMTISFTVLNSAINALPIYMTNDTKSRSSAYAIRMIFAGIIQLVVSVGFLKSVNYFGGDQVAWIKVSAILGTISFIACLLAYFGTKENVSDSSQEQENVSVIQALKSIVSNKYWLMVLVMITLVVFHQVATLTVGVYYAKYILEDENMAGNLILYHHVGGALLMFTMPLFLQKGISKRKLAIIGTCLMMLGSIIALIKIDGIFLILSLGLRGAGFGMLNSVTFGMLADTVDYGEWKTGLRCVAVTTSAGGVGLKLGAGLGTAALGISLSIAGYDGLATVQTASSLKCISFIFNVFPLVLYTLLLVILYFYRLDKELPKIKRDLIERGESLDKL